MDHKRIFLFTNDDDPLRGDEDEQKKVNIVAKVPPCFRYIVLLVTFCFPPSGQAVVVGFVLCTSQYVDSLLSRRGIGIPTAG